MENRQHGAGAAFTLGALLCAGFIALGYLLANGIVTIKALERTVTVKGLSEREVPTDVAIWPIRFTEASEDLNQLATLIQSKNHQVMEFLRANGFKDEEISLSPPALIDRKAQGYGDQNVGLRFSGTSTINVYTVDVDKVRAAMGKIVELGKAGIAISGQDYEVRTEFLFTKLNDLKPQMIEEATRNARDVAEKFAKDSQSTLGKIKTASQGQFTIENRDSNTPHIKKVRVVSTVEYYLSD
ncbi:MAG: SIMPL domain-containing protein [Gammaproteobacteria bacterium]|nr:SIMPL domain-containing protein [Gammaproteobacteria bacterium]